MVVEEEEEDRRPVGQAALGPWLAAGREWREGRFEERVHHLDVLHEVGKFLLKI